MKDQKSWVEQFIKEHYEGIYLKYDNIDDSSEMEDQLFAEYFIIPYWEKQLTLEFDLRSMTAYRNVSEFTYKMYRGKSNRQNKALAVLLPFIYQENFVDLFAELYDRRKGEWEEKKGE